MEQSKFHIAHQKTAISVREMVDNPTGKGSAYVANRATIKSGLNIEFVKLLRYHRTKFFATPYFLENGDMWYHVIVPSEFYKTNNITYDVLIEIEYRENKRLSLRNAKFYSNCPSFIYTYAYVFNQESLVIEDLKSKLPSECLTNPPTIRNPIESRGYEKSIYMACRYLLEGFCLTDDYVKKHSTILDKTGMNKLLRKIADPMTIVAIYQHAKYLQAKTHIRKLSATEEKAKSEEARKYKDFQRKSAPKHKIFVKKAQSKITARKASKSLLNSPKPTHSNKYSHSRIAPKKAKSSV